MNITRNKHDMRYLTWLHSLVTDQRFNISDEGWCITKRACTSTESDVTTFVSCHVLRIQSRGDYSINDDDDDDYRKQHHV